MKKKRGPGPGRARLSSLARLYSGYARGGLVQEGSYLRLIDFVYHSTLGFRVIKREREVLTATRSNVKRFRGGLVLKAHRLLYHSTLGLRVIKKQKKPRAQPRALPPSHSRMQEPLSYMLDFKTATFQKMICARIRCSNLVTEQLSPSNDSNGMQNAYL